MKTLIKILFLLLLLTQISFAQWVQTNGPYGGSINALAVSGTNLFAGTIDGVYLSTNNGMSWKDINDGLPRQIFNDTTKYVGINCLAQIGQNLFVGTAGQGVYLSANNGTNWTEVNSGLPVDYSQDNLIISSFTVIGSRLFAAITSDVFLSTNNGTNWTKVSSGLPTLTTIRSLATIDSNLFAATDKGVFLTTDYGVSWHSVLNNDIYILAANGTNLFAGKWGGNSEVLFLSTDLGASWVAVGSGLSSGIQALASIDGNIYAGSGFGLFLSTNNGANWTRLNLDLPMLTYVNCIANIGNNLFIGTSGISAGLGIFLSSNNGISWTPVNTGIKQTNIGTLSTNGTDVFAYAWDGLYLSKNNGDSWERLNLELPVSTNNELPTYVTCFEFFGTNIFAGSNVGIYFSADYGTSWSSVSNGLPINQEGKYTFVSCLAINGNNLFAGTQEGVFLSTNNGTNWTEVNSGLPTEPYVSSIAVIGSRLFTATSYGVFLSTNNGTNWTKVSSGLPTEPIGWSFAAIDSNLFACSIKGVFLTTDYGISWHSVLNYEVRTLAVSGTNLFAAADAGYGSPTGIFLSTDNGQSWSDVQAPPKGILSLAVSKTHLFAGLSYNSVWRRPLAEIVPVELTSFKAVAHGKEVTLNWSTATELNNQGFEVQRKFGSNDFITVGSVKGHGTTTSLNNYTYVDKLLDGGKYFYRLKQIDFNGTFEYSNEIEVEVRTLDKFTLEQNYPNPFNPTTTIGYVLQEKSNAKLTLLNALGEEIAVLVNEEQDKGFHKVELDGSKLASGVYFYQLKTGNFIETKKMVLMK